MLKRVINKIFRFLGKNNYRVDDNLGSVELIALLMTKLLPLIRGFILKFFLRSSKGIIFVGRGVRIKFKHKISLGGTVQIGDNVEINALSRSGVQIGRNVSILRNSIIECTGVLSELGEGLYIGDNVGIAQNCFIQVRGLVRIGNNVIFGPGVSIFSENHRFDNLNLSIKDQGVERKGVEIKDGVWIASNATILDGVTIGENSIVAAKSLVLNDVPPFAIVGGVPARVLKYRNNKI